MAAEHGHDEVLTVLINAGANVNAVAFTNTVPIHFAAEKGHERCVRILMQSGAMVDVPDFDGSTALHLVSRFEHIFPGYGWEEATAVLM